MVRLTAEKLTRHASFAALAAAPFAPIACWRVWDRARKTRSREASTRPRWARRPYDMRHALPSSR